MLSVKMHFLKVNCCHKYKVEKRNHVKLLSVVIQFLFISSENRETLLVTVVCTSSYVLKKNYCGN